MSHTFTFHFSKSTAGIPRIMIIIDLEASCRLCGYTEIQRFYHGTPFHSLTSARFQQIVRDSPQMLAYQCSNCGEPVGPDQVSRAALTYGFADQRGIIQAFVQRGDNPLEPYYILTPEGTFDPQALPVWSYEPDRGSERHLDIDNNAIFDQFGRVFNIKESWRALWVSFLADGGEGILLEEAAHGCSLIFGQNLNDTLGWLKEQQLLSDDVLAISITEPPAALPSLFSKEQCFGSPSEWLQDDALEAINAQTCCALALIDQRLAVQTFTKALSEAKLTFQTVQNGAEELLTEITTPRESVFRASVPISSILARAAHTGISPGEAGRATAEEIVGELMGLVV